MRAELDYHRGEVLLRLRCAACGCYVRVHSIDLGRLYWAEPARVQPCKRCLATERKQAIRDSNMVQKVMTSVAGFQFARLVLQKAGKL